MANLIKTGAQSLWQVWVSTQEAAENALETAIKTIIENKLRYVVDPLIKSCYNSLMLTIKPPSGEPSGGGDGYGGEWDYGWNPFYLHDKIIKELENLIESVHPNLDLDDWWLYHYEEIMDVPVYNQIFRGRLCAALACLEVAHFYGYTDETLADVKTKSGDDDLSDGMFEWQQLEYLEDSSINILEYVEDVDFQFLDVCGEINDEDPIRIRYEDFYNHGNTNIHVVVIVGYLDTLEDKYIYVIDTNSPFNSPYCIDWSDYKSKIKSIHFLDNPP